jgi:hypothetical protein
LTVLYPPWPLLARADVVLLVMRPQSLRTVSPAVPAIAALRREAKGRFGLMLIGRGIPSREIARHLAAPVLARLAWDPPTAAALCGQGMGRRRGPLMRTAAVAYDTIQSRLAAHATAEQAIVRRDTGNLPVVRDEVSLGASAAGARRDSSLREAK